MPLMQCGSRNDRARVRLLLGAGEVTCKRRAQPNPRTPKTLDSGLGLRDSLPAAVKGGPSTMMRSKGGRPVPQAFWFWLAAVPAVGTGGGCKQADGKDPPTASSSASFGPSEPQGAAVVGAGRAQKHAVGQTAQSTDYAITLRNVKECPVEPAFKPKQGYIKLGVEVEIEGTGKREVPVNPFYATITDSNGYPYNCTFGGCEPPLENVRIRNGEGAKGWITFEIPQQATGLTLEYSPFVIGTGKQTVRFELKR